MKQKLNLQATDTITLDDLLLFVITNQSIEQGDQNYFAMLKELSSIPQMILLKALLAGDISYEQRHALYQKLHKHWVYTLHKPLREQFGQIQVEQATQFLVEKHKEAFEKDMDEIFNEFPWLADIGVERNAIDAQVEKMLAQITQALPHKTVAQLPGMDTTMEVEQDLDVDTNLRVERDAGEAKTTNLRHIRGFKPTLQQDFDFSIFAEKEVTRFSLESYLLKAPELQHLAKAFEGIYLTTNVLQWTNEEPKTIAETPLFGESRTPFKYLMFGNDKLLILSQNDARFIGKDLMDMPRYHVDLGPCCIDKRNAHNADKAGPKTPADNLRLLKVKFLDGYSDFSKNEIAILREWITEVGSQEMEQFYTGHVLKGFPKKFAKYQSSSLKELFEERR